ncbi:hypothetical protein PTKIN_Ptkin02bG0087000 [Pterospermum kingtungense]
MEWYHVKLKFDYYLAVDCTGRGGGLALLWMEDFDSSIQSYLKWHINTLIGNDSGSKKWRFTGFYGNLNTAQRDMSWKLLRIFTDRWKGSWLCAECGLMEVPYEGLKFTWHKKINGEIIYERLNRGVANADWLNLFSGISKRHLIVDSSDHYSFYFDGNGIGLKRWGSSKLFRVEYIWFKRPECTKVVAE